MLPLGGFLDTLPSLLFVAAHLAFLSVGVWLALTRGDRERTHRAVWLYVGSQVVFLGVFAGILTLKLGVLIEQLLVLGMLLLIFRAGPIDVDAPGHLATAR